MAKLIKPIIAIVLALVVVVGGIKVVSALTDSPKSTIAKLEDAINDRDMEDIIECFEPDVQSLYHTFMGAIDAEEYINEFLPMADELAGEDEKLPDVHIKVIDVDKTSKTEATCMCEFYFDGYEYDKETMPIDMVKIDGDWYIDFNLDDIF